MTFKKKIGRNSEGVCAIVRRIVVRGHLFAVPFVRLTVVRKGSYATNK
jgi:hypothetical protein